MTINPTDIFNGDPAFPQADMIYDKETNEAQLYKTGGMSLRDYFAAKESEEDVKSYMAPSNLMGATRTRTEAKYRYADAMLKA